ncbi:MULTISPECIES: hypothetical protein [Cyanophyceae]|uniref:hypothetical protein n=1 Tax=Cyanophyceae TaxID=3028117 RepID=UPI001684A4FF|nr:hypothetical protein [Trichocoleus sp. FACHB-69]MBD1930408.1 hypothetical protein [Trichocoleus sp. FACHB-69]
MRCDAQLQQLGIDPDVLSPVEVLKVVITKLENWIWTGLPYCDRNKLTSSKG